MGIGVLKKSPKWTGIKVDEIPKFNYGEDLKILIDVLRNIDSVRAKLHVSVRAFKKTGEGVESFTMDS